MMALQADWRRAWVVRELIAWLADVNFTSSAGSVLHLCVQEAFTGRTHFSCDKQIGETLALFNLLLESNANPDMVHPEYKGGASPLHAILSVDPKRTKPLSRTTREDLTECANLLRLHGCDTRTCCCDTSPLEVSKE